MDITRNLMDIDGASTHSTRVLALSQTSHGVHFGTSSVRVYFIQARFFNQVSLGDGFYEFGQLGHYVRDYHR
ncbi:hypothetical protein H5410_020869, partial [Solanum commersonii]